MPVASPSGGGGGGGGAAAAGGGSVAAVFDGLSKALNDDLVDQTKAVFKFEISGECY